MSETEFLPDEFFPYTNDPAALTPWELRDGRWYKREDLHRNAYGVNGAKYRVCRHLITEAIVRDGVDHIVSAQSVKSPQAAITATLSEELGVACTIVVGASKPETAIKHPSIRIAMEAGAILDTTPRVAYNPVIQPYAARMAEEMGAYQVPYAISPPKNASREDVDAFLAINGHQVENMPPELETLYIAFGSGNTVAGLIYGLAVHGVDSNFKRLVLVGVGPDRTEWLNDRLDFVDPNILGQIPFEIEHVPLHGWFAEYADMMPETVDDIVLHPTYEGKVARYLNGSADPRWGDRDGTSGLWIVGGPM